ncbi:class I SAM-dependent methyltransferase [Rhizobium sp. NRK18]|uniref:class I SAM-dependent methyltransferase n=1 Tax=Rhizobium sp. NRK18 TaxID=2964667 RepID=UPI0021C46DB0|nr:class I SAM-dependent methyltransferase [Rhizobium sp. NRK18]MCQ2004108.1 class I SAM-dependent methyltransferase [Rhizobium sp. NRK18]
MAGAAEIYGEYGAGKSTIWVHRNTSAEIISVDTNAQWLSTVEDAVGPSDRLQLRYVDVGPVGEWGRPDSYARRDSFDGYLEAIWKCDAKPQVVLIDGRFRVACFLTCLKNADPGTVILFDDYAYRPYYHIVEEILPPQQRTDRMAVFIVPEQRDFPRIAEMQGMFRMVMD